MVDIHGEVEKKLESSSCVEVEDDQLPLLALIKNPESSHHFWQRDILPCFPTRYVIVIITFVGFMNVYALRINLSMAIVAMVNTSANHSTHLVLQLY